MRPEARARRARLFAYAGAAIIVLSGAGAVVGSFEGSQWGAAERPPTRVVQISPGPAPHELTSWPAGQIIDWIYVAPLHAFVASVEDGAQDAGYVVPFGEYSIPSVSWHQVGTYVQDLYYPGSGPAIFTVGGWGKVGSISEINASTLVPYANVSIGTNDYWGTFASNAAQHQLFYDSLSGHLLTVNTTSMVVTANVSLPGNADTLLYDPESGSLLATDSLNGTLLSISPVNGTVLASIFVGVGARTIVEDPAVDRVFITTYGNITVLNASTLSTVAEVPHSGDLYYGFLNPASGQVFFTDVGGLVVVNATEDTQVATAGSLPDLEGPVAYDPVSGNFGVAAGTYQCGAGYGQCVALSSVSQTFIQAAAFSAVPYFGDKTPWDLGGVGIVVGLGVLVARWIAYPPPRGEGRGERNDAVGTPAEIEEARQRWLAEADKHSREQG